jgi:hypothetical protein
MDTKKHINTTRHNNTEDRNVIPPWIHNSIFQKSLYLAENTMCMLYINQTLKLQRQLQVDIASKRTPKQTVCDMSNCLPVHNRYI